MASRRCCARGDVAAGCGHELTGYRLRVES
jgi:hypothetical protein